LLAQIDKNRRLDASETPYCSWTETEEERVRWQDREDHDHFDVCADDHCQRYQGITRATTPSVAEAIAATRGQVLTDDTGTLCDARFSKCCGGVFEEFENCWEPVHYSYLEARRDAPDEDNFPDLTTEEAAQDWILSRPEAFCNTDDPEILTQVLNNYDQETTDFYRWKVRLGREEIARLTRERTGIDFGEIKDLVPVARGTSGRLYRLEVVGTRCTKIIGKELEIRRALSPSHLYSSAFVVERVNPDAEGVPEAFVLHGAGWGHGVGLCQIGAAVMGAKGYDYQTILSHYFVNAILSTLY
ncbi:MAG: SpoIID/LytB domain-containing protein, partial [Muribaculaceae bacterium]|nr:SpoIID/LytB domain-containing protein [Muribaculaceae bacterium]